MAWRTGSGGTVPFGSNHLVEHGAGLLGELGPLGGPRALAAGLEHPVGDGDLTAAQVGLGAPSRPGRESAVVPVKFGLDVEGVVAPHGPACRCARRGSDPPVKMIGRVVGEGGDPVGAGAGQGGVDLGEGSAELLALGGHSRDMVLALLLVLGQGGQPLPKVALSADRLLGPVFGDGELHLGVDDRPMVGSAPAAPPAVLEPDPALRGSIAQVGSSFKVASSLSAVLLSHGAAQFEH